MMARHSLAILSAVALWAAATVSVWAEELIMIEEHGCYWCGEWDDDIAAIYPKTPEGKFAPLRRIDVHTRLPDNLKFQRAAVYTPTFILVRDGQELARIEGYPGEDFFWGLLGRMLIEHTDFQGAS